ncbi:cellulose biosynthesis protein BcsN [Fulvimarina sp. MAC8]|uniref:cellulose biosynthesis protein BcsN n=1 Tax=Fulvimarina sp. MAC8 TaxID=3162874 RepID=UPI0032EAFC76
MCRFPNSKTILRLRLIGLAVSALALGGCTQSTGAYDVLAYSEPSARLVTSESIADHRRWAELPADAGRVLDVIENRRPTIVTQRIVLSGDGSFEHENMIRLETGGADGTAPNLLRSPRLNEIIAELGKYGLARGFAIADEPNFNAYGPFGYAYAREKGGTCIYAWQWLDLRKIDGASSGLGIRKQPMSIRIHICQKRPLGAMVASIRNLRLFPATDGLALATSRAFRTGPDALNIANRTMGVARWASSVSTNPAQSSRTLSSIAKTPKPGKAGRAKSAFSTKKLSPQVSAETGPNIPAPSDVAIDGSKISSLPRITEPKPAHIAESAVPDRSERPSDEAPFIPAPPSLTQATSTSPEASATRS